MQVTHLDLSDHVGQPLAAGVLALHGLVGHALGDDEEDLGEVGVVRSEDDGVVAVVTKGKNSTFYSLSSNSPSHPPTPTPTPTHASLSHSNTHKMARCGRGAYLSMRSHRKSKVWAASSLSSLSGSQASQWGRISVTLAHSGLKRITLPTAEMQFSVALTFSFERDSAAWMAPTSSAIASGGGGDEQGLECKPLFG